jgi:hypothetical protein
MKIKQYIVTYDNNKILNRCLKSINGVDHEIIIIDNFGNCKIEDYNLNIRIIKNELRPQFSTGHLSKDWNAGLVNGFKDLNNPDCDIVISCQNDTKFNKNWYSKLIINLLKYKYIACGIGDQFQAFTPEAIKNIGLYDERFCNIGFQEADYFLRALIYYSEHSSINDCIHGRTLNLIKSKIIEDTECGFARKETSHMESFIYHGVSEHFWKLKWDIDHVYWGKNNDIHSIKPKILNYFLYPYFEKDILNLEEKYY